MMKKARIILFLLVICSSGAFAGTVVQHWAVGWNCADALFPKEINFNTQLFTLSGEYLFFPKWSIHIPLSINFYHGLRALRIEIHPRFYILGKNLQGAFVALMGGVTLLPSPSYMSSIGEFGANLGGKWIFLQRFFVEGSVGLNLNKSNGGMVSALTLGVMF